MSSSTNSLAPASNAVLVDRFRNHDERAFAEIFWRHRQMVYRVCLRYLGHHHDAEDVTQETFRRAASAMPRVDSQRPLEPWLITIAANRCRSFLSRRRLDQAAVSFDESTMADRDEIDSRADQSQRLATHEQLEIALARLPAQQRHAFELVHQNQLTYPEAALQMGCPTGSVKTWVRRAKQSMQRSLGAIDNEAPVGLEDANTKTQSPAASLPRGVTVAALASFCVLGWFGLSQQSAPSIASLDVPPGTVMATEPRDLEIASSPLEKPVSAPELHQAIVDWQWASLDAFSRTRLSAAEIEALPVAQWVSQSTPTLDQLRSGFVPLGSALQRVAKLFQGDLASVDLRPDRTPGRNLSHPGAEQPAVDGSGSSVLLPDVSTTQATFASVT